MTTQATNRAVFRTSEKLGFKLGNTTHIFAANF
jgi:dTDP-4-amino-4,6-dideoxy-D-galactose acyltransferase